MRRLLALALLLAVAAACQQDGERQAATTTTATATTAEPTTTTKPPATPAEKAWIAGVRKLRQRMDRVFHQSVVLTQAVGRLSRWGCRESGAALMVGMG
jgi:hypothetical protein